jgi:phage tail-like protein
MPTVLDSSKVFSDRLLNHLYENKLPKVYRDMDNDVDTALKRFLQSLIEGGYAYLVSDAEKLKTLINPATCPDEFFPYLYKSFGFTYYYDIDVKYHRKFLASFGEIFRRKGTYSCVEYLVKTLTGMPVTLSYVTTYQSTAGRFLVVTLLAETMQQLEDIDTSIQVIQRFIGDFIPFYITPVVVSQVNSQSVSMDYMNAGVVSVFASYTIVPA